MAIITGTEKANTGVGRGINLLKATRPTKAQLSTYRLFDMDKIPVEYMSENHINVDVYTENSKIDLAKSLSISVGAEAKYMLFSASVSMDYSASTESSQEKAYTKLITTVRKKRHFFPDSTYKNYISPEFQTDLNGTMTPDRLFKKYGTHFIREAGVGGALVLNIVTNKNKNESKESLSCSAKASFGDIASGSYSQTSKSSVTTFLERSSFNYTVDGGKNVTSLTLNNFFTEYPSWVQSVEKNSASWEFCYLPNDNSLVAIWSLCKSAARRKELFDYFMEEAKKTENSLVEVESFVSNILINNESRKPNARTAQAGWELIDQDLNEGAKGNFIYITYKTMTKAQLTKAGRKPITNLLMVMSDKALKWSSARLADGSGKTATYYRIDSDLNKSAGGKYIYLCYTYDTNYAPLVSVDAYKDNNRPQSNEWDTVTWNGSNSIADANRGAGGRYIYVLQKHKR